MTRGPAVELNAKLVELKRDDVNLAPRRRPRRDYRHGEFKSSPAQAKSTCEGGHEVATNHVQRRNLYRAEPVRSPAGNLRAGGYEPLGGHRQ
jgi:hypothetical protein